MKRITCFLLVLSFCLCPLAAGACTSFAVFSPAPLYGLNWDYPSAAAYLRLNQAEDHHKVFSFGFETEYGMATNGSMNDRGFIAFVQDLHPREKPTAALDDATVQDLHDLASWSPYLLTRAQEVREMLEDGMRVGNKYHTLHDLFADAQGDAFVLEEYEGENVMTQAQDGVLVMTNFPNCQVRQVDPGKNEYELRHSHGFVGVDRYRTVHKVIAAHRDEFDVARGFEALQKAAQYGAYRTRFSGVYDPVNLDVYMALERDYDHIWKLSLTGETVEGYLGFGEDAPSFSYGELCEGELGIPFETLISYGSE